MQHDIYFLGIVLLETGLNFSFTWPKRNHIGRIEWLPDTDIGLNEVFDHDLPSRAASLKIR